MTLRSQFARDPDKKPPPIVGAEEYFETVGGTEKALCKVRSSDATLRPWFTLVLGSGCSSGDGLSVALSSLLDSLEKRVDELYPGHGYDGRLLSERVRAFGKDLIRDRFRPPSPSGCENGNEADAPPAGEAGIQFQPGHVDGVAHIFAAASTLTPLYHFLKAWNGDAPRRTGHDDVGTLGWDRGAWDADANGANLKLDYLEPFRRYIGDVETKAGEIAACLRSDENERPSVSNLVAALAQRLKVDLGTNQAQPKIDSSDLMSLAELAWLCLAMTSLRETAATTPGWSDLLVDLGYRKNGRLGVPLLADLGEGGALVQSRFTMPSKPGSLHEAAADLLTAQYAFREGKKYKAYSGNEPGWPPVAAAFVTSFDLDLELALLHKGTAFAVALPVYVVNDLQGVAHGCWLAFEVPGCEAPRHESDEGRNDRFRRAAAAMSVLEDVEDLEGPVVIRLAGCPFVQLPSLNADDGTHSDLLNKLADGKTGTIVSALTEEAEWLLGERTAIDRATREERLERIRDNLELRHAVLLSEHDAMFQSDLDLIAEPTATACGLPSCVAAGREGWFRFWMLLGVQIRDSAIRHRMAALLSSLPRTTLSFGSSAAQWGVAVNAHVSDLEQVLLAWNGLHVVQSDVVEFAPQLMHYAAHLNQRGQFNSVECDRAMQLAPLP